MPAAPTPAEDGPQADAPTSRNGVLTRLGAIIGSHTAVDMFAAFTPPLIGVLQVRCELTDQQTAWLLGIGSLSSGLSQPISAWISDRLDSRLLGAIGLALAAVCLSSIGYAHTFASLLVLFIAGTVGVGIFHPVGASTMGQLADRLGSQRRTLGVSVFFVAGMMGGILGSLIARHVAVGGDRGFELLRWTAGPGILIAVILLLAIRHVPHRPHNHHLIVFPKGEITRRWAMVSLLYVSSALRFTVNVALIYLIVRWAEHRVEATQPDLADDEIAASGASIAATLNALMILGMAIGGMASGWVVKQGREKWPLVLAPIVCAPAVALFGVAPLWLAYGLAVLAGIGFAATVPVTLGLGQRLLPHRTSLASGLMLGGAWAVAAVGPPLAQYCLGSLELSLAVTFALTGGLLVISGLVCLPLRLDGLDLAPADSPDPPDPPAPDDVELR